MTTPNRDDEFTSAFVEHYQFLLKVAMRYAPHGYSEDVVQAALLEAWRNRDKFRGTASVKTWLGVIVRNEAYDLRRRLSRECELPAVLIDRGDAFGAINDLIALDQALRRAEKRRINISVLKSLLLSPPEKGKMTDTTRIRIARTIAEIRRRLHLK